MINKIDNDNLVYIYIDKRLITYIKIFDIRILIDFYLMSEDLINQQGYQLLLSLNLLKQIYELNYKSNGFTLSYKLIEPEHIYEVGELLSYKLIIRQLSEPYRNSFIVGYNSNYFYSNQLNLDRDNNMVKNRVIKHLLSDYSNCLKKDKGFN